MRFHVITLFPEMIEAASQIGVVGQALKSGKLRLETLNPRKFTSDVHHTVDDRPFGGGDGMVMLAEPLTQSVREIKAGLPEGSKRLVIHTSPRGRRLDDELVRELAAYDDLILVSSRYGGVDQRFLNSEVDLEVSIGDYILSGGEIAVLAIVDSVGRQAPGVLGNASSFEAESFAGKYGLLEHPQFTRPRDWAETHVPKGYLSGDHAKIEKFLTGLSVLVTLRHREDLLVRSIERNPKDAPEFLSLARGVIGSTDDQEWAQFGLGRRADLSSRLEKYEIIDPPRKRR